MVRYGCERCFGSMMEARNRAGQEVEDDFRTDRNQAVNEQLVIGF